ncbi:MAG: YceD family protein [Acutalibacteraceae bacterium]
MLLDLKNVFLTENEQLSKAYSLDLSEIEIDGIKPMPKPVEVKAQAENRAGVVKLTVNAKIQYARQCDRCSADAIREFNYTFEHTLVASLSGDSNENFVETPDFKLELDPLVTADIILELPLKFLCSENCKGLCQGCGANLNIESCKCTGKEIDPRLEVLKQLIN